MTITIEELQQHTELSTTELRATVRILENRCVVLQEANVRMYREKHDLLKQIDDLHSDLLHLTSGDGDK